MGKLWGLGLVLGVLVLPVGTASAQSALPCNSLCHIWFGDPDPAVEPDAAEPPEGSIPMGYRRHRHHRRFVYEERPYRDYGFRPSWAERPTVGHRRRLAAIASHRHQARMMPSVWPTPAAASPTRKPAIIPAAATSAAPPAAPPARPKDVPAAPLD